MEKVIKGLEHHYGGCEQNDEICPYWQEENCGRQLIRDAMALLKEQEDLNNELVYQCDRIRRLVKELAEQPQIIRRKDCKHSEPWYGDKSRCFLWHETGIDVFNDGFCNYGKRKEGR